MTTEATSSPPKLNYREMLKAARKRHGKSRESDEDEPEGEPEEPGTTVLWKLFNRKITLHPGNIVRKAGKRIRLEEATALRVAEEAQLPVPHVYSATRIGENNCIEMSFVEGQTLESLWEEMPTNERLNICQQLRDIVDRMRAIPPPPNYIGGCDGKEIRDTRPFDTYLAPSCKDEQGFNAYLMDSLAEQTPPAVIRAFAESLRTNHRIVFSHCDLAPTNIIIKDGKVQGLIDWEIAGWYPEYWEYAKFFHRPAGGKWRHFADQIFSESYPDELIHFSAFTRWQKP